MRYSKLFIPTLREQPKEAETSSHNLMLRAGLIRRLSSGIYSYLPLGWRVLNKVVNIIKKEMEKAGAQELLLPSLHPLKIWEKSGRDKDLADVLYSFKSPHGREFVLSPTHEEVITDLISNEISSYKQLPLMLYQIQTKFRDEARPRSGVLRSLEFIMKDAYSFDIDQKGLEENYQKMYKAYCNIFRRCGLPYKVVEADPGAMGGDVSHEFMVVSEAGEDKIVLCHECNYAASLNVAKCSSKLEAESSKLQEKLKALKQVDTPGITTVEKVSELLNVTPEDLVKTLIYNANGELIAVLVRGDCEISEVKLKKVVGTKSIRLANDKEIQDITGSPVGYSGPVGLDNIKVIADNTVYGMKNFITGANEENKHFINVNVGRDFKIHSYGDLRFIKQEDDCPNCGKKIAIENSIEVGHIFKLGTKYSDGFNAAFLNQEMKENSIIMGCYGIGIDRIVASCIEANHDEDGIIWPPNIAPFTIMVIPIGGDEQIQQKGEEIYYSLIEKGMEVLLDDRDERAGVKFNDADLLGIPYRIIIGKESLSKNNIEFQTRKEKKSRFIPIKNYLKEICKNIK